MRVRGQITYPVVPEAYLVMMESIKQQTGIPISWLAAVAQQTNFNPSYQTINSPSLTLRQFGIAGIWADVPEVSEFNPAMPVPNFCGGTVDAGWGPRVGNDFVSCSCPPINNQSLDPNANLQQAAAVFIYCQRIISSVFGASSNELIFFAYILGCYYVPTMDPTTGLPQIPAISSGLSTIAFSYIEAQAYYAPTFGEDPLAFQPGPTPPCVTGFTWNSASGLCCNAVGQCQPSIVCPTGTSWDQTTNQCVPIPCSASFPCIAPLVCQPNGSCVNLCSATLPCTPPFVCNNGTCVQPCTGTSCPPGQMCDANGLCGPLTCSGANPCPTGFVCDNGFCQPPCQTVPCTPPAVCQPDGTCQSPASDILPFLIVGGIVVLWPAYAALHEAGQI